MTEAHAPQGLCSATREAKTTRSPSTTTRAQPSLAATRESPCAATKTQYSQKKKRPEAFLSFQNQRRPRPGCSVQPLLLALRVSTSHCKPLRTGNGQGRSTWWVCNAYVCLSCLACCIWSPVDGVEPAKPPIFLLHHRWRHSVPNVGGSYPSSGLQGKKEPQQCLRRGRPDSECRIETPGPRGFDALPPGSLPKPGGAPHLCDSALSHTHPPMHCAPSFGAQPHCKAHPAGPTKARQTEENIPMGCTVTDSPQLFQACPAQPTPCS